MGCSTTPDIIDLISHADLAIPRGATRWYSMTVYSHVINVAGKVVTTRQNLTGAHVFLVVKDDRDSLIEVFRLDTDGQAATGSITTVTAAELSAGQTFTLDDGVIAAVVFEFDFGGGVAPGNVAVDLATAVTTEDVRDAIITAITGAGFDISASADGEDVALANVKANGALGNTTSSSTVTDPGFIVTDMTDGWTGYDMIEILTQSGDTLGVCRIKFDGSWTEDLAPSKCRVFEVWVVLPDGRGDAVLDESAFHVTQRLPNYLT